MLEFSARLMGVNLLLQTIELLCLRSYWRSGGVWQTSTLVLDAKSFIQPIRAVFGLSFSDPVFEVIVGLRLLGAVVLVFYPIGWIAFSVFIFSVLILFRFKGIFNGGSDYMTTLTLIGLSMGLILKNNASWVYYAVVFIAAQSVTSYFIAGISKLKSVQWRKGKALNQLLPQSNFRFKGGWFLFSNRLFLTSIVTWSVLFFEILFPFGLINFYVCLVFVLMALVFHFCVFLFFGLNRFFWSWLVTFPCVLGIAVSV